MQYSTQNLQHKQATQTGVHYQIFRNMPIVFSCINIATLITSNINCTPKSCVQVRNCGAMAQRFLHNNMLLATMPYFHSELYNT